MDERGMTDDCRKLYARITAEATEDDGAPNLADILTNEAAPAMVDLESANTATRECLRLAILDAASKLRRLEAREDWINCDRDSLEAALVAKNAEIALLREERDDEFAARETASREAERLDAALTTERLKLRRTDQAIKDEHNEDDANDADDSELRHYYGGNDE